MFIEQSATVADYHQPKCGKPPIARAHSKSIKIDSIERASPGLTDVFPNPEFCPLETVPLAIREASLDSHVVDPAPAASQLAKVRGHPLATQSLDLTIVYGYLNIVNGETGAKVEIRQFP